MTISNFLKIFLLVAVLQGVAFVSYKMYHRHKEQKRISEMKLLPDDFYEQWQVAIFEKMPSEPNPIIFLGDSHTQHLLIAEVVPNHNILNRGMSGDSTQGIINRIEEVCLRSPKAVFLMIGVNDLIHGKNKIRENYSSILDIIHQKSPRTKIILQSVLPHSLCFSDKLKVKEFNKFIEDEAIRTNCQYVDLYSGFQQGDSLNPIYDCGDKIHLNARGYLKWMEKVKPILSKL